MTRAVQILLAEDDRILRKAGEIALSKNGYTVILAIDGEEALAKAREHRPDLILLDVIMPKLGGFDVLSSLKDDPDTRQIPVIMLSNLDEEADVRDAVERGAQAYYVKSNLGPDELAHIVAATLAKLPTTRDL